MKHIVLTGGGTAGHVTPNIALIPGLQELGYSISYIGSHDGIEKKLIEDLNIPYYAIRKTPPVLQPEKLFGPVPRPQGHRRGPEDPERAEARHHLFQRRVCSRPGGSGCKAAENSGNHSRIRYVSRSG